MRFALVCRTPVGVALVVSILGCSRSEPPPRFAPPTPPPTPAIDIPIAEDAPVSDDVEPPTEPDVQVDTPEPPPPETVDAEVCRAACDNALTVTLAELPEAAAPSKREELTRALREDCPARCLSKASLESARCIAGAKSALQLAACP